MANTRNNGIKFFENSGKDIDHIITMDGVKTSDYNKADYKWDPQLKKTVYIGKKNRTENKNESNKSKQSDKEWFFDEDRIVIPANKEERADERERVIRNKIDHMIKERISPESIAKLFNINVQFSVDMDEEAKKEFLDYREGSPAYELAEDWIEVLVYSNFDLN